MFRIETRFILIDGSCGSNIEREVEARTIEVSVIVTDGLERIEVGKAFMTPNGAASLIAAGPSAVTGFKVRDIMCLGRKEITRWLPCRALVQDRQAGSTSCFPGG